MRRPALTLVCAALAACVAPLRVPTPPSDRGERRRAEADACRHGALPAWLDDAALSTAAQVDRGEAQASSLNDSFMTDTAGAMARPPPALPTSSASAGSRAAAMLADRREFEERCQAMRSAGRELVPGAPHR
ncbi:MAG TPA: hypothetical protein VM683_03580 [Anaeromyxobacteraceae bacterium]|nr:hypothetical protein [Anaeromyxobacteraceae bacterium]